jgi:hypothetical protein
MAFRVPVGDVVEVELRLGGNSNGIRRSSSARTSARSGTRARALCDVTQEFFGERFRTASVDVRLADAKEAQDCGALLLGGANATQRVGDDRALAAEATPGCFVFDEGDQVVRQADVQGAHTTF